MIAVEENYAILKNDNTFGMSVSAGGGSLVIIAWCTLTRDGRECARRVKEYSKQMLLLHLSDIHFKVPDCLNPELDPNQPVRTSMLRDIQQQIIERGPAAAILIGGDIAFKGAEEEYRTATAWISKLCDVASCPQERVFVVPGNHDINREAIRTRPATRNAQAAIAGASHNMRESIFRVQISDRETAQALLTPIAAYNDFAAKYSCQVYLPDRLKWVQDLDLGNDVKLRLHGLTSTLLSGLDGQDDARNRLYLSPMQTAFDSEANVVHLVLCHHPPDWLMDQDDALDAINGAVAIQMFGHKHRQRIERDVTHVRFSAGAVNPDRYEVGWSPRYNLITLSIDGSGDDRVLGVEGKLREWQSNPNRFRAVETEEGEAVFRHSIRFPAAPGYFPTASGYSTPDEIGVEGACSRAVSQNAEHPSREWSKEAAMGNPMTRNLVFRIWSLRRSEQRDILEDLGLLREDEADLPEAERFGRALIRASEEGLLEQLAREVEKRETSR